VAEEDKSVVPSNEVQKAVEQEFRRREAANAPMDIDEVSGGNVGRTQQKSGGGFSGMNQIIAMVVIAAVICYVMLGFFAPKLSQYKADITRLENDLVAVRADYALKASIPAPVSLTSVNASIAALQTGLATAQSDLTTAKAAYLAADASLTTQIGAIKPYDDVAIKASITSTNSSIATLTTESTALQTKVNAIQPTDLTAVNTAITALQASVATLKTTVDGFTTSIGAIPTMQTSIGTLQSSVTTLTGNMITLASQIAALQYPIFVKSITPSLTGGQVVITSSSATYALVTLTYTLAAPAAHPLALPTMSVLPFGSVVVGAYYNQSGANDLQVKWIVRTYLAKGDNTVTWTTSTAMAVAGVWSMDVEVSQ
jgi:hypothetical protein